MRWFVVNEDDCSVVLRRIVVIVRVNVSDCFWYLLTRVILD